MPKPPFTFLILENGTYIRWPGFETRFKPEMAGAFPSYFKVSSKNFLALLPRNWLDTMSPSFSSIFAISRRILEYGNSIVSFKTSDAFRIWVNMSAIGSVIVSVIELPAAFHYSGYQALVCRFAKANPAQVKVAHVSPLPSAPKAPQGFSGRKLGLLLCFCYFRYGCHNLSILMENRLNAITQSPVPWFWRSLLPLFPSSGERVPFREGSRGRKSFP